MARMLIAAAALKGAVVVGDDETVHTEFHTLVLSNDGDHTGLKLTAAEDDTSVVIVCVPLRRFWLRPLC